MIILLLMTFSLLLVSLCYWLYQAHKAARDVKRAFDPYPHTAAPHDAAELRRRRDGFDPYDDRYLSCLLKRQAD